MENDPSDTQNGNEQDLFDGLETDIKNNTTDRIDSDLNEFMNALQQRAYILDMIIQDPDVTYLHELSYVYTDIEESAESYIESLFESRMDNGLRKAAIKTMFMDADFSQKTLNQFLYEQESKYDSGLLDQTIEEIFNHSNDIAAQKLRQKFIQDFSGDIPPLLRQLYPDKTDGFWSLDTMILDASLEERELVETFNAMFTAQYDRITYIEDIETDSQQVKQSHENMINKFSGCVSVILNTKMDNSERIDLIVGLFMTTSESQDDLTHPLNDDDKSIRRTFTYYMMKLH